jgi:hypothetical protein
MGKDSKKAAPKGAAARKPKNSSDAVRANKSENGMRSAATVSVRDRCA